MSWWLLADIVTIIHFAFVLFCIFGAFFCLWRPKVSWVHVPSVIWGGLVEIMGWICPITPLENWLRQRASGSSYRGSFIDHYIVPLIYPPATSRNAHILMGIFVLVLNFILYYFIVRKFISQGKLVAWIRSKKS